MSDYGDLAYTLAGIDRRKDPYSERRTMAQQVGRAPSAINSGLGPPI